MNTIPEILNEVSKLQGQRNQLNHIEKELEAKLQELTLAWQGLCSHPTEYRDERVEEDGTITIRCSACSKELKEVE